MNELYRTLHFMIEETVRWYIASHPFQNVRIEYSNALKEMDWGDLQYLHPRDGWHLSETGKNEIARRINESAENTLHFVGIR